MSQRKDTMPLVAKDTEVFAIVYMTYGGHDQTKIIRVSVKPLGIEELKQTWYI